MQERLATVAPTLPTWAAPPVMLAPVSATGRAMQIGMTSKDHSLIEMSMTAYWTIRARLLRVPGVANVAIWNERLQMMTVQVEPAEDAPRRRHASTRSWRRPPTRSTRACCRFSTGSVIGTGGIDRDPEPADRRAQRAADRHPGRPGQGAGRPAPTGAHGAARRRRPRSSRTHQPLIGDAVINGEPGLLLVVEKLPWANTLQMTAGVEDAIAELQPGLPGVTFDTHVFRQADFIELAIDNLTQALVLGFLLVVVILALFLFEWRVALISLLTIPLSLVATLLVLLLARRDRSTR